MEEVLGRYPMENITLKFRRFLLSPLVSILFIILLIVFELFLIVWEENKYYGYGVVNTLLG